MSSRTNMIKMGKYISKLRKKKGYTQKNLGDILDVSDKTVSKWEKGVVAPDITLLKSLANTLDVTVEELLAGEDSNTIEAIDMYSKITKKKIIKGSIVVMIIMLITSFFIFRIEEYYAWHITSLYSEGNISSTGFILSNNKESKVVIKKIILNGRYNNSDLAKISSIKIRAKYKDKIIYNREMHFDDNLSFDKIFNNYSLYFDYNDKISINNLVIEIELNSNERDNIIFETDFK